MLRDTAVANDAPPPSEIVVFEVGTTKLGLPTEHVQELLRAVAITSLPGAPPGVEGVIDLRGRIVPVFDLRARFALAPRSQHPADHVLICLMGESIVAVRTDRIVEIRAITQLEAVPDETSTDPMTSALAKLPDGIVVICNLSAILTEPDLETLARAMSAAMASR